MSQFLSQPMTREAALRIGLAARALQFGHITSLVEALASRLGLPLSESKLATLSVSDLRAVLGDAQAATAGAQSAPLAGDEALKRAVRLFCGDGVDGSELPVVEAYAEGDLPGSIRVACASHSGEMIDGHFGSCDRFLIYQVAPGGLRLIAARPTLEADHEDDRNAARARLIADCQVVYVQSIGGPAAAKVVRVGAHPVKVAAASAARELLAQLQRTLTAPPPWLAKAMGVPAQSLARFAEALETSETLAGA